jgi:hypothetical protein
VPVTAFTSHGWPAPVAISHSPSGSRLTALTGSGMAIRVVVAVANA